MKRAHHPDWAAGKGLLVRAWLMSPAMRSNTCGISKTAVADIEIAEQPAPQICVGRLKRHAPRRNDRYCDRESGALHELAD